MKSLKPSGKSYVCTHVFDRIKPVLLVSRPNGSWCFLCGDMHDENGSSYRVVGASHLLEYDPTLYDLPLLDAEEEAERESVGSSWLKTRIDPDS